MGFCVVYCLSVAFVCSFVAHVGEEDYAALQFVCDVEDWF